MDKRSKEKLDKAVEKATNVNDAQTLMEVYDQEETEIEAAKCLLAYKFKLVRERAGMTRKEFSEWLGIPYRTMQEWELGRRTMPDYVLNLIEYKVDNEIIKMK